jgi:hypothetical protein
MFHLAFMAAWLLLHGGSGSASARDFVSRVDELDHIPAVNPHYAVPIDANLLFYVQRSVNANTVVYIARPDHPDDPVEAYWRLFNIDGHIRTLNFAEQLLAYGVSHEHGTGLNVSFHIRALPEQELTMALDAKGRPAVWTRFADRAVRLVYVYLQVDDRGVMPGVLWLDLFGLDQRTGKPLREHLVPR